MPVAIDGTTEPGVPAGTMGVTLNGDGAGNADGLVLAPGSGGSTIRGLAIRDFNHTGQAGIRVQSNGNQIIGDYIGTGANGTGSNSNGEGVIVEGNNNAVGGPNAGDRNVISGNADAGVLVKRGQRARRERHRGQLHRSRRQRSAAARECWAGRLGQVRGAHGRRRSRSQPTAT